ncbi:MAG: A24 family peptidase [Steroidobacteraceae bacterium]
MTPTLFISTPLALGLLVATVSDFRNRRISNVLTVAMLAAAVVVRTLVNGGSGAIDSLGGALVGFAALLPFYLLGGFGAGDVKLMAASAAWLGIKLSVVAVGATLFCGGVIGLAVAGWCLLARRGTWPVAATMLAMPDPNTALGAVKKKKFPYAVAIASGVAVTLWLAGVDALPPMFQVQTGLLR